MGHFQKWLTDDYVGNYEFFYDGEKHANVLWDITEEAAADIELIGGEIASWNEYLDWKKQLAELRIKGIKYIAAKVDLEERQMCFLAVSPSKEEFDEFKTALYRNGMSVFSNEYSTDRWVFDFNKDIQNTPNCENGIALQFVDFGWNNYLQNAGNLRQWDEQREYCRRNKKEKKQFSIGFYISEFRNRFPNAYLCELKFDLSINGSSLIEKQIRRNGTLTEEDAKDIMGEFYSEGYIAASQIGDFALISRLKAAIRELVNGKSVSQNLDDWLFDITKARTSKQHVFVTNWQNEDINPEQKLAVEKILSAPDVCLIQGPPGTGKTTVIAEAIYQLVVRGKRVLVTSQANLAVDNALERLITNPNVRAIRLGDRRKIASVVERITERNVIESFYHSITEYVDKEYLEGWRKEDEEKEKYDAEKKQVLSMQNRISDLEKALFKNSKEITRINEELEEANESLSEAYRQSHLHEMEIAGLQFVKMYCDENTDELHFSLCAESVEKIYYAIKPYLQKLQKQKLYLSRLEIDVNKLHLPSRLRQSNDILKGILRNMRQVLKMYGKVESGISFGSSEEYELLKTQEMVLRDEMAKNASMDVIAQWQQVKNKMQELNSNQGGLSEEELELFNVTQQDSEDILEQIEEILCCVITDVEALRECIKSQVNEIIDSYNHCEEDFEEKQSNLEIEFDVCMEEKSTLEKELSQMQKDLHMIYDKYHAGEEDIYIKIEKAKENVHLGNHTVSRDKWESIFSGLTNWIEEIPDYIQENEMYLDNYINGCNVVGVSCTENTRTLTEKGFQDFDVVIIDEVSKATPPELLIPLLKGRKAVLVGDHRQLPPLFNEHEKSYMELVQTQEDELSSDEIQFTRKDFEKYKEMVTASLFQRYFENATKENKQSLLVQYRMHADIMDIVNMFYDGKLKDGAEDVDDNEHKAHKLTIYSTLGTEMIIPERHAYWFDSSMLRGEPIFEQRRQGSTSTENILEAYMILELLRKIEFQYANQNRTGKVPVGVISFYFDQVKLIRNMIRSEHFHSIDIEVNTVDRFQGKEKEIILVSLVRNVKSERRSVNSHIAAFQRINVAFSRAENLLIIIGATNMYANQPVILSDMDNGEEQEKYVYHEIIDMLEMRGAYFNSDDIISDITADTIFDNLRRQDVNVK